MPHLQSSPRTSTHSDGPSISGPLAYRVTNQQMVDVKEMGERVLQFAIKREEPVLLYHQHQDQYRAPDPDYSSRARSRSQSPPSKRHRPDNRGKRRDNSRRRGDKPGTTTSPTDTRQATTTTRQHDGVCYRCGKKHGPNCKLTMHPDANTNPAVKWSDTITGRAMAAANAGTSIDLKNRWSHSEKRMVPLETSVVEAIRAALHEDRKTGGTSFIYNVTTALGSHLPVVTTQGSSPPCCDHTHNTSIIVCFPYTVTTQCPYSRTN